MNSAALEWDILSIQYGTERTGISPDIYQATLPLSHSWINPHEKYNRDFVIWLNDIFRVHIDHTVHYVCINAPQQGQNTHSFAWQNYHAFDLYINNNVARIMLPYLQRCWPFRSQGISQMKLKKRVTRNIVSTSVVRPSCFTTSVTQPKLPAQQVAGLTFYWHLFFGDSVT